MVCEDYLYRIVSDGKPIIHLSIYFISFYSGFNEKRYYSEVEDIE